MFARKIRVSYISDDPEQKKPCPIHWMDNFAMRSFTNASVFDDTLPVADGELEIGSGVPLIQLCDAMQDWFQRKGYISKDAKLLLEEVSKVRQN